MLKLYQVFVQVVDEYYKGISTYTDWAVDKDDVLEKFEKKIGDTPYMLVDVKPVSVNGKEIYLKDVETA